MAGLRTFTTSRLAKRYIGTGAGTNFPWARTVPRQDRAASSPRARWRCERCDKRWKAATCGSCPHCGGPVEGLGPASPSGVQGWRSMTVSFALIQPRRRSWQCQVPFLEER